MPRNWLYYFALIVPLVFRVLLLNTTFVEWLWYQHYEHAYQLLAELRVQPQFLSFVDGWKLPVFVIFVISWWQIEEHDEGIPAQFLMLPLAYVPFAIIGDMLINGGVGQANFFIYPLIIIPFGYAYVFAWTIVIWLLGKMRLVIS